ncbi:uncharacterized protein LOC113210810 isoform X1 [Frankliniella occidentalis]|uniref:Uncharacterized protein LOC113210810 isoform X1 n=2 Tax=Frankliniella occidentalis TaxID=133901 RepID=A0A9C6X9U6_FRAOC|nr:uncharacterized protein LOC113210810 isoform X1 [Frankliniella occidentalis]
MSDDATTSVVRGLYIGRQRPLVGMVEAYGRTASHCPALQRSAKDPGVMAPAAVDISLGARRVEQEQERECTAEDRAAWKRYRGGGRTDHASARRIMNRRYAPRALRPFRGDPDSRQGMRYAAERDFFDLRDDASVRALAREVTEHQYRDKNAEVRPVDLAGRSARQVIAAARLQQETWVALGTSSRDIHRGIPLADRTPYTVEVNGKEVEMPVCSGPDETYAAGRYRVASRHRTEEHCTAATSEHRLGMSFVKGVSSYERDVVPVLEAAMDALGGAAPGAGQRRLAELLIQFARSHSLAGAPPELSDEQREKLFKVCFLVMEKEQAQWQASFFVGHKWQLGMSVAFARLLILFREGAVTLRDVFNEYGVYSNHPKRMVDCRDLVRKRCDAVDRLYVKQKGEELTLQHAMDDLREVYGGKEVEEVEEKEEEGEGESVRQHLVQLRVSSSSSSSSSSS